MERLGQAEPGEIDGIFEDERRALEDENEVGFSLLRANLLTRMAGVLFVHDIEVGDKVRRLNIDDPQTFLRLPFDEAIAHFLERGIVSFEDFSRLSDIERQRAFAVKDAALQTVLDKVKASLDDAMRPGGMGLREFVQTFEAEGATANYLENVYRTSTATSYQAGRLSAMQDPDVVEAFPYWEYVTVGDDRVRDSHAALHGKVWRANDPEALAHYPPNGYQCRCSAIPREDAGDGLDIAVPRNKKTGDYEAISDGFNSDPEARVNQEGA